MAISPDTRKAPFGPPSTVLLVIRHYQQREVPETITPTHLTQIGVKDSVMGLVRQSLAFLNLVREDGTTTENFKALRFATDEDRVKLFRDLVTEAYRDIFAVVNPESANRIQLYNAFRPYSPASQHDRMITLFLALCQEAGLNIPQAPRQTAVQSSRATRPAAPKGSGKSGSGTSGGTGSSFPPPPPSDTATSRIGLLFGVSESDIGNLTDDEFQEVWGALGKVARARARRAQVDAPTLDGAQE